MPKVSVIIPTHSRPLSLVRAVESAHSAGSDVEVVVVDDASRDATADVCKSMKDIKYVRLERNQGVAGARNVGILASSADLIAFLDDDDLRLPGSLDAQIAALSANREAGFVCGPVLLADEQGTLTGEVAAPQSPGGDVFWEIVELKFFLLPAAVVIRKDCFYRVGLFNSRIPGIDDWDMWARVAELFPVVVVTDPVSIYRQPTPFSQQGSSALGRHLMAAVRHQPHLLALPRSLSAPAGLRRQVRRNMRRRIADTLSWNAARRLPEGAYRFALENFLAAVRLNPLWAARPEHFRQLYRSLLAQRDLKRSSVLPARADGA